MPDRKTLQAATRLSFKYGSRTTIVTWEAVTPKLAWRLSSLVRMLERAAAYDVR